MGSRDLLSFQFANRNYVKDIHIVGIFCFNDMSGFLCGNVSLSWQSTNSTSWWQSISPLINLVQNFWATSCPVWYRRLNWRFDLWPLHSEWRFGLFTDFLVATSNLWCSVKVIGVKFAEWESIVKDHHTQLSLVHVFEHSHTCSYPNSMIK